MYILFFINILFIILIYRVNQYIFFWTALLLVVLFVVGFYWIYTNFQSFGDQFLYTFALSAVWLLISLIGFFIAIFLKRPISSSQSSHE